MDRTRALAAIAKVDEQIEAVVQQNIQATAERHALVEKQREIGAHHDKLVKVRSVIAMAVEHPEMADTLGATPLIEHLLADQAGEAQE